MTEPVSRRSAVASLAVGAAALFAAPAAVRALGDTLGAPAVLRGRYRLSAQSPTTYSVRALRIVEQTVAIDLLNQFRFADYAEQPPKSDLWLHVPRSMTRAEYELYRTAGTRIFGLGHTPGNYEAGIRFFADWNSFIAGYDDWFMRIDDASDFARVKRSGKVGILFTLQNSDHFRTADDVTTFFSLGQRVSQITYNATNRIGSGFLADTDSGLTPFGAEIVARMNSVGMAVDLSHCADRTTLDALDAVKKPAIYSHASCRALMPGHMRCKTDEMIQKMAKTGGVMGIPMLRFMIRLEEPVTVEHVLDHFDHVAKLVGVEHVGVGSDMDLLGNPNPMHVPAGMARPQDQPNFERYHFHTDAEERLTIRGLDHPRRMLDLTEGLIRRRYSDANIALMIGGNWSRTLSAIWSV